MPVIEIVLFTASSSLRTTTEIGAKFQVLTRGRRDFCRAACIGGSQLLKATKTGAIINIFAIVFALLFAEYIGLFLGEPLC